MSEPTGFSWITPKRLAALAKPDSLDDLLWLRRQGIDILITLTEEPLRRDWLEAAGLLSVHVPIPDMEPPTLDQFARCVSNIDKANAQQMAVAVHCYAGRGRTGTILAGYLVAQGMPPQQAIQQIRQLRPGSIETEEQEAAVHEFARFWAEQKMKDAE